MYIVEKQKNGRYAVKKKGASRASKTFDTYQEAILYCTKKNKELGIETTTTESTPTNTPDTNTQNTNSTTETTQP